MVGGNCRRRIQTARAIQAESGNQGVDPIIQGTADKRRAAAGRLRELSRHVVCIR